MGRPLARFILLMVFIVAALAAAKTFGIGSFLEPSKAAALLDSAGPWGPAVYIIAYAATAVLMLPGLPVTVLGGLLFGPVWGSVYVMAGATIGAALAFLIARRMGREWVASAIKGGRFEELDRRVALQGWKVVALTRLVPIFPYNFLNYAFGLTSIGFASYIIASFFCMIPGAVAYVALSSSIPELIEGRFSTGFIVGAVLLVTVSVLGLLYKRLGRKRP